MREKREKKEKREREKREKRRGIEKKKESMTEQVGDRRKGAK